MIKKLLLTIFLGVVAFANPLAVDSTVSELKIKDQFEKEHTLNANIKTILFASDKATSDMLRDYLLPLSEKENILEKNNAVYIADISGMPSLITKFFALPKMKKYPFKIFLLDETNNDKFLMQENKITIYEVEDQLIKDVKYIATKEELATYIK